MIIKIVRNENGNPPGKLADAELHFSEGPLDGLKLIGFGIWESRNGGRRNVTLPARQYSVNGERRSFALLRPVVDIEAQDRLRTSFWRPTPAPSTTPLDASGKGRLRSLLRPHITQLLPKTRRLRSFLKSVPLANL
jgi:hypothetical protein